MRKIWKQGIALVLVFLLGMGTLSVSAETDDREQLLKNYCTYRSTTAKEVVKSLRAVEQKDPVQGKLWRKILSDWSRLKEAGYAENRVLPKNLPQDASLCIVVFGYGLNENGSMKPELLDRLRVAQRAAQQYPNAYIAVTGGETAGIPGISEAGEMASWLRSNGIANSRLIVEDRALSTTENAQNVYDILVREYAQVEQIAVVTSDYHVAWSAILMQTVSTQESMIHGVREIPVVAGASCKTNQSGWDTIYNEAQGIARITELAK